MWYNYCNILLLHCLYRILWIVNKSCWNKLFHDILLILNKKRINHFTIMSLIRPLHIPMLISVLCQASNDLRLRGQFPHRRQHLTDQVSLTPEACNPCCVFRPVNLLSCDRGARHAYDIGYLLFDEGDCMVEAVDYCLSYFKW